MAKVYGLFFGAHGQSTTLIVDGEIEYAIEDERITRKKAGIVGGNPYLIP
jgi:predicted NodU family carbamoyl transferase